MRAILIDPYAQEIVEVEYSGDWKEIKTFLQCDIFTTAYFDDTDDSVYVDDEGLYVEDQAFFTIGNYPQPLAGRGLILGCNDEGDSVDCKTTLEEAKAMVKFLGTNPMGKPEAEFNVLSFDEIEKLLEKLDA